MTWPIISRFELGTDPFHELIRLHRQMSRMLGQRERCTTSCPSIRLAGTDEQLELIAALPGFDEKSLQLTVEGNALTIEGSRATPEGAKPEQFLRRERESGSFSRTVQLPYDIESDRVSASFRHGVLTVTLPRKESTKPRKVVVQS